MKKRWIGIYFLLLLLPYLVLLILGKAGFFKQQAPPPAPQGFTVTLYRHERGETEVVALRDYLWGVLAGEMPASYPTEALKAQAVASYSYLLHRIRAVAEHPATDFGHSGDICDNPDHCKAYRSPEEAAMEWGEDWLAASDARLKEAVEAVLGEVLLYDEAPANAVFHAISGGRTEAAADVWGAEVPYLCSVESPWDAEAKGFHSEKVFTAAELQQLLGQTDCTPGAITLTKGGSVAEMVFGSKVFTGRELRSLLRLRSTRFTVAYEKETFTFSVSGYGHQVGMSQHGASILADSGYDYRAILAYYYPGTVLTANYFNIA